MPSLQLSYQGLFGYHGVQNMAKQNNQTLEGVCLEAAAERGGGRVSGSVVEMEDDGMSNRPGPAFKFYEIARLLELTFCSMHLAGLVILHISMYMRDSLHQIDHGITFHVLRGILRLFYCECKQYIWY